MKVRPDANPAKRISLRRHFLPHCGLHPDCGCRPPPCGKDRVGPLSGIPGHPLVARLVRLFVPQAEVGAPWETHPVFAAA